MCIRDSLLGDVKNPGKLGVSINPDTWKVRKAEVNPTQVNTGGCVPFVGRAPLPGFTWVGFGFTSAFLTRTTACSYCFGEYRSRGIAKCPDVQEPEELSGCLWFSAVCHVRSIFVSNDISGVDK